jgi:excisionase family DNA binding protein
MKQSIDSMKVPLNHLYTFEEVAVALGVSVRQVERYVAEELLRETKLSPRKRRIRREDYDSFVKQMVKNTQRLK